MLVRNQITQLAKLYNNTLCHNPPPHAVVSLLVVKQEIILVELAADLYCLHQKDLYKTCIAFKITSTNLYCLHHWSVHAHNAGVPGYTPTPDLYCLHHQPRGLTTRIARPPPLAHHFPLFHYLLLFDLTPLQSTMSKMNIGLNEMLSLQQTMMPRRPMFSK